MFQLKIELPWPNRALHPNARPHFYAKARATKAARNHAYVMTQTAGKILQSAANAIPEKINVKITFNPPDKRERDTDGMIASCKAYLDGIADALDVNDYRFDLDKPVIGEIKKNGLVVFELA